MNYTCLNYFMVRRQFLLIVILVCFASFGIQSHAQCSRITWTSNEAAFIKASYNVLTKPGEKPLRMIDSDPPWMPLRELRDKVLIELIKNKLAIQCLRTYP